MSGILDPRILPFRSYPPFLVLGCGNCYCYRERTKLGFLLPSISFSWTELALSSLYYLRASQSPNNLNSFVNGRQLQFLYKSSLAQLYLSLYNQACPLFLQMPGKHNDHNYFLCEQNEKCL